MEQLPPEMLIGIEELDRQHQGFLELLMRLQEATDKRYGYAIATILTEITVQARIHFTVEETLMRMLGFPEVDAHHAQHVELASHLDRFKRMAQDHEVAAGVSEFIRTWLTQHVSTYDRRFAEFFRERSESQPA